MTSTPYEKQARIKIFGEEGEGVIAASRERHHVQLHEAGGTNQQPMLLELSPRETRRFAQLVGSLGLAEYAQLLRDAADFAGSRP